MKKIFSIVLMLTLALTISAQTAFQEKKVLDNTYVGVNAGVTTPLTFNQTFPLNSTFGVKVGKEFNTVFGVNIEDQIWFGSNYSKSSVGTVSHYSYHNAVRTNNLGFNATLNVTNMFLGYNKTPKTFEIRIVSGIGWLHGFNNGEDVNDFSAKTGLNLALNTSNGNQFFVEPNIFWNLTENSKTEFNKNFAQLGLTVGYVYYFANSNGTHSFKTYNVGDLNKQINDLKKELSDKKDDVKLVTIHDTVQISTDSDKVVTVYFLNNSYTLDKAAKTNLDKFTSKDNVTINAYSDELGTDQYNQILSEKRAKAVSDYLSTNKVSVKKTESFGEHGSTIARIVTITNK